MLALPHYLIIGFFVGSGTYIGIQEGSWFYGFAAGLVGILAFIVGIALLFTGTYLRGIFDLIVGLDRWVIRVGAYAALMTDVYPPFRLDLGGSDPDGPDDQPPPAPTAGAAEPTEPAKQPS